MNDPGVIFWSEVLKQTLGKRKAEHRNIFHVNDELAEAIAETNERILKEQHGERPA